MELEHRDCEEGSNEDVERVVEAGPDYEAVTEQSEAPDEGLDGGEALELAQLVRETTKLKGRW